MTHPFTLNTEADYPFTAAEEQFLIGEIDRYLSDGHLDNLSAGGDEVTRAFWRALGREEQPDSSFPGNGRLCTEYFWFVMCLLCRQGHMTRRWGPDGRMLWISPSLRLCP